jgi:UDP-glucose 4-epimerase
VDRLIAIGDEVLAIDNLSVGSFDNLKQHSGSPLFTFRQACVTDAGAVTAALEGADRVFHLAALADIVPSIKDPCAYHRANVTGTVTVLEAARASGVRRFVYAASSSCYGIPDHYPTPETAPIRPMYPYALTKWLGEQAALHWAQVYGLPVITLRLFNVFGPRARTSGTYGAVLGTFLAQKLAQRPMTVVGDGSQTRDFTYVTDVVDAFVTASESPVSGVTLNVGSGNTYSVNELVRLLDGTPTYIPKRPGEPQCTFADIRRIKETLGWQPKTSFAEGVRLTLEHIHLWQDAPVWTPDSIREATSDWFKYLSDKEATQ